MSAETASSRLADIQSRIARAAKVADRRPDAVTLIAVSKTHEADAIQPLIVQASLGMAGAVLSEASLSFLGLGIPPPAPSWGTMIEEARGFDILYNAPHVLFFPGIAIALTVLAFNFIGDGLRQYLDPKQRAR